MSTQPIALPEENNQVTEQPAPKVRKPKETKPRLIKRRKVETVHKKYQVKQNDRLVTTTGDEYYFLISFPEADLPLLEESLKAIHECSQWNRVVMPQEPQSDSPAVSEAKFKSVWRVRKTEETLKVVAAFGKKFKFDFVGDILMQASLSTTDARELERMSYLKSITNPLIDKVKRKLPKGCKPMPFQWAGFVYAERVKKTFIADEMGLGKTIQALLVMLYTLKVRRKQEPWLVFVPAAVKINWYREARKWLGSGVKVGIAGNSELMPLVRSEKQKPWTENEKKRHIRNGKKWLIEHQVVIVNYDRIVKYSDYLKLIKWGGIVLDESHYCKSNSFRTRAAKDLMDHLDPEYILALSGTPVLNNPKEMIRQLQLIGHMDEFGGPVHFLNRYCSTVGVDTSKLPKLPKPNEDGTTAVSEEDQALRNEIVRKVYENQIELNKQLRSLCYVRRERSDVLSDLPDLTRTTVLLDINNRKLYDKIEKDVISYLMDRVSKDEKFLKKINHMSKEDQVRAIKDRRDEVGYRNSRAEALARLEALKQCAAVGKLDEAQEWMENVINENDETLVMFANHIIVLDELEARFPKHRVSLRAGSDTQKQAAIDAFRSDKKVKLMLSSLKVGGTGVDGLQYRCNNVAFMELGWNPAVHDQAESRLQRMKQKNAVNSFYLIAKNTVEEKIARLIERKRNIVDATSFGDPVAKAQLSGTILGDLIGELTGRKSLD